MADIVRFDTPEAKPNIIKVMGVGGGGSNAVTHMFAEGITGVDFILCNTDDQALQKSPVQYKLHIGEHSLGAGNVPAVGRQAAEETEDKIRESLGGDTKMLFITAGMGGGTGTGAAPVVARISRELGILTVGIVTLPFSFEGKRRQQQAEEGIAELRKHVDALLVISNDKLREEYGNMKLTEAFKKADDVLKIAAKGIAEIITVTGYVNVDFEDVNNVMRNSGKAIMGSGYATGEDRAIRAVEEAVNSPLLDDSDITGAKNILVYITSGTEEVSLDEVTEINEYVQDATGKVSEVIWGNGEDMTLENGIRVTLIATGFEIKDAKEEPVKKHTFAENVLKETPKQETKQEQQPTPKQEKEPVTEEKEDEQIRVIIKHEEPKQPEPAVKNIEQQSVKKTHTLYDIEPEPVEEKKDEVKEDDGGYTVRRVVNEPKHEVSRAQETATPSVRRYDNPFANDDDDIDVPTVRNMSSTAVAVEVKPAQKKQVDLREELRRKRLIDLGMSFKTQQGLEHMENVPAYARLGLDINSKETEELSHVSMNKNSGLSEDNTYINVDVD